MATRDFLPRTEAGLLVWLQNFSTKIATYAAGLSVTPAQVTQFQTDFSDSQTALNAVQASRTTLQSLVEQKDTVLDIVKWCSSGILPIRMRSAKTSASYRPPRVRPAARHRQLPSRVSRQPFLPIKCGSIG